MLQAGYKFVELVSSFSENVDTAVQTAISRSNENLSGLKLFNIKEIKVVVDNKGIDYQVTLNVGLYAATPKDIPALCCSRIKEC